MWTQRSWSGMVGRKEMRPACNFLKRRTSVLDITPHSDTFICSDADCCQFRRENGLPLARCSTWRKNNLDRQGRHAKSVPPTWHQSTPETARTPQGHGCFLRHPGCRIHVPPFHTGMIFSILQHFGLTSFRLSSWLNCIFFARDLTLSRNLSWGFSCLNTITSCLFTGKLWGKNWKLQMAAFQPDSRSSPEVCCSAPL